MKPKNKGRSGLGLKRRQMCKVTVSMQGHERFCNLLFLDSGAHSLFNLHVIGKDKASKYNWYGTPDKLSKDYRHYMDRYAKFVKKYQEGIDYYVNVDAIYNPELSWAALKYLENEHGLDPVPVIHGKTPIKWVEKHIEAGYEFIGIGGLGQEEQKADYCKWADQVFDLICSTKDRTPCVRTHGFAMTSYDLMMRYSWWSVDSVSWAKAAGFGGNVYVPYKRKGAWDFSKAPMMVGFSSLRPGAKITKNHYLAFPALSRKIIDEWLEYIRVPLGSVDKNGTPVIYGVLSQYHARALACLRYFEELIAWMPPYPIPFHRRPRKSLF